MLSSYHVPFVSSESGAVYSCGLGNSGELGQGGGRLESWLPQLVNEPSSHTVVSISAGGNHSAAITGECLSVTSKVTVCLFLQWSP